MDPISEKLDRIINLLEELVENLQPIDIEITHSCSGGSDIENEIIDDNDENGEGENGTLLIRQRRPGN